MALRKIHNTYYIYFRDIDGKIKTRSLKTTFKDVAEKAHTLFMRELQSKKSTLVVINHFPEQFPNAKPVTTVAPPAENNKRLKLVNILPELEKIQPVSPTNRRAITRFISEIKVKYADQVTPEMALAYLEKNYSHGRNYKAFNNNKGILHKAFRLLLVKIGLPESPFERIACRKVTSVESHRPISDDEFRKIFAAAAEPFRTAAALGFYAGADMSTAFGLPGNAVDLDERIINWKRPKTGTKFICGIHGELLALLERIGFDPQSEKPILDNIQKTCSTKRIVYYRELFDTLGIVATKDGTASFHSLRASFFTRCDKAKLHRRTTSLAGGHTEDRMNDLYSHDVSAAHEVETLPSLGLDFGV